MNALKDHNFAVVLHFWVATSKKLISCAQKWNESVHFLCELQHFSTGFNTQYWMF